MKVPQPLREADEQDVVVVRTYDAADGSEIVVDLGATGKEAAVDVLAGTAIVVVDDRQYEFELPPEASDVSVNNGVLTIRD